jgi:hypothetical protein
MSNTKKHPPRLAKTTARRSEAGKKRAARRRHKKDLITIPLSMGNIAPEKSRMLILIIAIIFFCSILIIQQFDLNKPDDKQIQTKVVYLPSRENSIAGQMRSMVKGYPIESMMPYITKKDPEVAAFMVAIAKQESGWGTHKPVLDGQDCYNYWGFRLKTDRMGSGGHTCFDSPQQAVDMVATRISQLINEENINTPKDMVIWKCGYACQNRPKTQDDQTWIKDVSMYYQPLMN